MPSVQKLIEDSLPDFQIRELYLYQLTTLKNIENWNLVTEIGKIHFKGKHINYHGGLIRFQNSIYFLPDSMINALSAFRRWNFSKNIYVIPEKEWEENAKKKK